MDDNENYIFYNSYGDKIFTYPFEITREEEIVVFVENNQQIFNTDYAVNLQDKKVEFTQNVGTTLVPKIVFFYRNIIPERKTNFSNDKYIDTNLLELEFNNILSNQKFFKDFHIKNVKTPNNFDSELYLPTTDEGKPLIWNNNKLVNSKYKLDEVLDNILDIINNPPTNNGGGDDNSNNGDEGDENGGGNYPEDGYNAKDIKYDGGMIANSTNVEEALHALVDCGTIKYDAGLIAGAANVKEALNSLVDAENIKFSTEETVKAKLTKLSLAENISLNTTNIGNTDISNIQKAVDDIYNKLTTINVSSSIYTGPKHCVVNGITDANGDGAYIGYAGTPFKINIIATEADPLRIAFTNNNELLLKTLTTTTAVECEKTANKLFYIYAEIQDNNVVFGYTASKPFYLNFNPVKNAASTILHYDKYVDPSDFFHIPTLTMYNSQQEPLKRVYIGQVIFDANGAITFSNNYAFGDSAIYDITISQGQKYSVVNKLGMSELIVNYYYKGNLSQADTVYYTEGDNYDVHMNYVDNAKNTKDLVIGFTYNINHKEIWGVCGQESSHVLYNVNSAASITMTSGTIRLVCKRSF